MATNRPPDPLPRPRGGGVSLSSTLPIDRPGSLHVKMDEMKEHITNLKKELETERIFTKRLKRNKVAELHNVQSEEQKKSAQALATLRLKLESEKTKELENLRESLKKQMYSERNKLLKEKDASAKSQEGQQREMDAVLQKTKNQYLMEAKEEARKVHEAERTRFLNDTAELRSIKKKLEADLENAVAANRQNGSELRRVSEEHAREMDQLKKDARRDIIHLVEELKTKQRVIAELEKELGQQAGYALKLRAEKDTLGQELNLAKMADAWERRSQSVSRSTSSNGPSPDSFRNEDRRQKMTSPSSSGSITIFGSREGLSTKPRPDLNGRSKRVDAPLIKAKSPVSRIPTLSSSENGRRTPSPGHEMGKEGNSVRRRTMSPLVPSTEKKLRMVPSPLNHQRADAASDTSSCLEGDVLSTPPSRTSTPVSMASIDLDREDLEVQHLISAHDMDATAWLKEKEFLEEQLQLLKKRLAKVEESKSKLNWSLRESQNQNDLLEFRVLELEESKNEIDEREQTRDVSTPSSKEQLTAINEAKDNTATSSLPDQPNLVWDIHFDTSIQQLTFKHIPELKQKLDQLACKENSSASEDQKTFLVSISKVLQSAQETIVNFEETDLHMKQRLTEMEDQYQNIKSQTTEQKEDNQRLEQRKNALNKSLSHMEAEASSYKVLADMKATEIDKLRTENSQIVKEIADARASTQTEESYKERIVELESLLEEQRFHIESLCNQHSEMESDLEKHQGRIKQLEHDERMKEHELDRVEGLHLDSYQNERSRSSFMDTETEKTDSELQAESLWEAIEATKSSETDTQLNFLQDQSDHETSVVEELFQVLEKSVEKATPTSSAAMDDIPKKEGEEEDGDTVADDVDTDSSFSLPLPDDEVDDDDSSDDDEEPPRRKLSVPELFKDTSSGLGSESRWESKDQDEPIEDLTEADAAAREWSAVGIQREPRDVGGHKDRSPPFPGVDDTMNGGDDISEDGEENDKEWNESEILQRLGAEDKTSSTKVATDGTHSVEFEHVGDDQDEDTQTEISDLQSQNEELKSQVEEKEMTIQEMKETARTLKHVIRDQMTESEKLREADESNSLEGKLEELKMKEDTLKRVVKDLQISEQSLKEQWNQLSEDRDDLKTKLQSFEDKFNQGSQDTAYQENLDQRCKSAEERVKEIEKLNVSMMEKYEMEIAEKDVQYQRENEQLSNIRQVRDELQQKFTKSEDDLMEKDKVVVALTDSLAKFEENEASERLGKEQMSSKFQEMEEDLDKVQKDFARKCAEAVQLQAQLVLLGERMEQDANKSSDMINEMKENMEAKEREAQHALDDMADKDKEIKELHTKLVHVEDNLKANIEENTNKEDIEAKEKQAQDALDNIIVEKDKEIGELQMQLVHAEANLKTQLEENANKEDIEAKEKGAQDALNSIIAEKDKEIGELQMQLAHAEANLKAKLEEFESKKEKLEKQEKEAQHAVDDVIAEKDREINELQIHLTQAEDNMKAKLDESEEKKILEVEESKRDSDEEISRLREQLADFQDSQEDVSSSMEKAEREIALKVAEVAEVKASLLLMEEKYETEEMEKENIKKAHGKLEEELMTTRESVIQLEEQRSSLKKLLSEMKSEVEILSQENKALDEKLSQCDKHPAEIEKQLDPVVCEDVIVAQAEHSTEAVPAQGPSDVKQEEQLQYQLKERDEEVTKLEQCVRALEGEKVAMEERMKGIEELLKDSVIDNEDMLRDRIVELEVVEKTLKRRVQELESAQKEAEEKVDATMEEMKHLEESYEERFKELRASEQMQLEKAAELEEIGNHWKSETETLKEQIENSESINQSLKEKLQEVETELEELQVVSKLAGDELGGTQKSLPSLMDEGLGALDTGRTDVSHFGEEYEDYEDDVEDDFVFSDDMPQESVSEAQSMNADEKVELQKRVEELEKSEAKLMEKVEILQQSESELAELLESLQQNEAIVREASEQLEDMRAHNLEVEQSLDKALKVNEDLQEQVAEIEIEKDELLLQLDVETSNGDRLQQLQKDLETAAELNINLESKVEELEEANNSFLSNYKDMEEAHNNMTKLKDDLEKELKKTQSAHVDTAAKLAEHKTPNSSFITPDSISKLEEENQQIAKQLLEAEEERAAFREKMKALEADIDFLEELKAGGEQSISELSFQIESLEGEVASKSRMLEEHESILEERHTEMGLLRRELEEKSEFSTELEALNKQLKEEYIVKNKMFQDNANILEKKVVELDMTKKELESVTATCDDLRATISELEKTVEELSRVQASEMPKEDSQHSFVEEEIITREVQSTAMMAPPPPLPTSLPPPAQYSAQIDNEEEDDLDDDDIDSSENSNRIESAPTIEALQLRIQHLIDNEEKLREKIDELEQRQSAFNETLAAADSIMTGRENDFKEEISELESSNNDLKEMLQEAKIQGQVSSRRSSEDYSIFDCIDEDGEDDEEEEDFDYDGEDLNAESGKPKDQAMNTRRRSSARPHKIPAKLKRVDSDDTLTKSQEKIADLMVKVDDLEKQNADLLLALEEKEEHHDMRKTQAKNSPEQDYQAELNQAEQDKNEMELEIQSLNAKLDAFKPFEDQFKQFLEEKDLSEADRHAQEHKSPGDDVYMLREKMFELESLQEELKEELQDTKLSEETLTEISEEQLQEIQRLKDEVDKVRTKALKEKTGKAEKLDVHKNELGDLENLKDKLSSVITENQEYETRVQLLDDEIRQTKKTNERLEDEVDILNAHVEELGKSEGKLTGDLEASEKSQETLRQSNDQLERTVKALEESIEMLTSRVQESDQGQERVKASNKVIESKFKDMLMSEATLKNNLKQMETTKLNLEQKVDHLERSDEKWKQEMQEMEEAILDTKRQSRKLEEEVKLLKLDNGQLKHENEMLMEKLEDKKSQDLQTQNRLSEMELGESNLRLQLKNAEMREGKLKEQLKDLEDSVSTLKQKVSRTNQLEGDYDSLQRELQAATQRAEGYERSNVKLEEKLQQLEQNLRSHGMVSLSVSEYQELKAQATLASWADGDPLGAREGGGGAAGEVWMRLDQKNKELREVQELYNQSVRESVKLKQSVRDLQTKGVQSSRTQSQNVSGRGENVEAKSTQTIPLKLLTKGALQSRMLADDAALTLEDFLNALPHQGSDHTSSIPIKVYGPLIQTDQDLIQVDQSAPSFLHRQPIREQPIGEEVETGHVTMTTRPMVDAGFDFDGLGLAVDEIDRLRVGSSVSDDIDVSLSSDGPPLPDTSPPGQGKRYHGRTNSTSSDISDLAPSLPPSLPPPPPLPSLPPPPKLMGGVDEGTEQLLSVSSQPSHIRAPSFDSGMETQEPEIETSTSQDVHTGPPQLRLPTVPGSSGAPPVAPKPGTPLWLKKMVDWQNAEKEKEHGEYGRMKEQVEHLTRANQVLEDELRQLKVDREQMKRQVQGASDARELQQKLQSRDLELEDKERQVIRLKTEIKEREMEVVRLKSQLEAFSQAGKTSQSDEMTLWRLKDQLERTQEQLREKVHLIHSHDATLGRVKADLVKNETELLSKKNALQLKMDELTMVKERMRLMEEGQRDDTTKLQLSEYSSKLTTLTAQNESLRTRLSELEPLERQVGELRAELSRSSNSTRSSESLEKKLQMAQKMLQDKTENEMRLAEDNASLQQRVRTTQTQDAYTKDLEREYTKLEEQMGTLEHERNEAELAVAPLKAKVSYLTKKCQERDNLIRKLKQEIVLVKSEKSADLLDQIGNLSTLLPDEAYNEPLKTRPKPSKQNGLSSSSRKQTKMLDLSDLLDDDEREFLKRESLENGDVLLDVGHDEGEISLQELMKQTKSHHHGIRNSFDDINLEELDLLGTAVETGSDQFSISNGIGQGSRDRMRRSPVSIGFGTVPSSYKSRASKDIQIRTSATAVPTLLGSLGLDLPDGLTSAPLATQQTLPTTMSYPTQPQYQTNVPLPQPPFPPPTLPQGYPQHTPSIPQNHLPGVHGTLGPAQLPAPPLQGIGHSRGLHPSDPSFNTGVATTNQYLSERLHTQAPQLIPQMLNNSVPRPHSGILPNRHLLVNGQQPMPSSMYGVGPTSSVGASLPLSHQNVLNLPGNHPNTNGLYQGSTYNASNQGLSTGIPDPPRSLSISREVSKHSVLLTWSLPSMDVMSRSNGVEVVGYRIYVNGQQKQLVSSAHMTKALVDGIYLKTVYRFGICTVSANGLTSSMAELSYNPASSIPSSTPSESVRSESVISSEVASGPKYGHKEERMFMAVYTYDPESHSPNDNPEYELMFTEGDLITVYGDKRPDGFYHGKVLGRKGLVPSNFIEEISKVESRKRGLRESHSRRSRESSTDGRRTREKKGRNERESRRREGQSHGGSRV